MRGRSIRVSCLLDLASMGQNNLHGWDRISNTDLKHLPSFFISLPPNQGKLYNTFGGHAEVFSSAGHLRLNTYTSCSVLFSLRIYGIHGLVIGETELLGVWRYRYTFSWCFHLFCLFLVHGVVKACVRIIHNVFSHNTQSISALRQINITIMLFLVDRDRPMNI